MGMRVKYTCSICQRSITHEYPDDPTCWLPTTPDIWAPSHPCPMCLGQECYDKATKEAGVKVTAERFTVGEGFLEEGTFVTTVEEKQPIVLEHLAGSSLSYIKREVVSPRTHKLVRKFTEKDCPKVVGLDEKMKKATEEARKASKTLEDATRREEELSCTEQVLKEAIQTGIGNGSILTDSESFSVDEERASALLLKKKVCKKCSTAIDLETKDKDCPECKRLKEVKVWSSRKKWMDRAIWLLRMLGLASIGAAAAGAGILIYWWNTVPNTFNYVLSIVYGIIVLNIAGGSIFSLAGLRKQILLAKALQIAYTIAMMFCAAIAVLSAVAGGFFYQQKITLLQHNTLQTVWLLVAVLMTQRLFLENLGDFVLLFKKNPEEIVERREQRRKFYAAREEEKEKERKKKEQEELEKWT